MGDGDASRRRRGSAMSSQRHRDRADATETINSGSLAVSTPTHRRARSGPGLVRTLDELTEISTIAAAVALQKWWRRHSAGGQRVARFQKLCRRHVLDLVRRRRTMHTRSKVHAIALQMIFLGVFSFSILHGYTHDRLYRFTRAITSQYLEAPFITSVSGASKTFSDITTAQDFVEWMKGPFVSITYMDHPALASSASFTNNHIVGGIRIGQLRVKSFNCSSRVTPFVSSARDNSMYDCYGSSHGDFTLNIEANDPIQVSNNNGFYMFEGLNDTATNTERSAFFSTMSVSSAQSSLPAPAYSVVLPRSNHVQASSILATLATSGYIDGQTRAVMLDLGFYNAMIRQVAALRFLVELPASGGAIASLSAGVAPLVDSFLVDAEHWVVSVCHMIVMLFYAYFFLDEVLALARSRSRQWQYQAVWQKSNFKTHRRKRRPSLLHCRHGSGVRLFGLLCYVCTWLLRLIALLARPSELPLNSANFVALRPYVETFRAAQLTLSASVCLAWIELLLMLRVSVHVDLLVRVVVCAIPQLFVLVFMVALVVMGYASACLLVLGAQTPHFQSLPEALRSLLAILLQTGTGAATGTTGASTLLGFAPRAFGEVGHDAAGTSTLRTLLLACFLLLNVFVAANLFLIVLYDGYLKAKREIDMDRQLHEHSSRTMFFTGDDEESLEAAPMHLNLGHEAAVYGRAVTAKLISLVPRKWKTAGRRRKGPEMQSTVLPADMPSPELSREQDGSEDEYCRDTASVSGRRRWENLHAQDNARSNSARGTNSRDRSSDSTKLLEGMVLQLALQNEALLRAVNELKQDVQALQRNGDTGTSDRDILRRGPVALTTPARVHKHRDASVASGSMTPDAPNNHML